MAPKILNQIWLSLALFSYVITASTLVEHTLVLAKNEIRFKCNSKNSLPVWFKHESDNVRTLAVGGKKATRFTDER